MAWTKNQKQLFAKARTDARTSEVAPAAPNFALPRFAGGLTNINTDPKLTAEANSLSAMMGRITYGAGPIYTRSSSYPADQLEPARIRAILREADLGIMYRKSEMDEQILERDAHLRGIDLGRRVEVSGKPFRIQPRNETPLAAALANWVRGIVDDMDSFDQSVEDLLSANGRGYSAGEITWQYDRTRIDDGSGPRMIDTLTPVRIDYVHQKHFTFDQFTDEPYLMLSSSNIALPPGKFVFHSAAGTGLIERRGFMRPCVWLHAMKQWAFRDLLVFQHLYGIPQLEGIYEGDVFQQDAQRDTYAQILQQFGEGFPAIHPKDFEIKVTPPPPGGASTGPHAFTIGLCNAEMSKVVQGETLTTEVGGQGSYAIGDVHADTKHAIITGDARKLARTFRSDLFAPMIDNNLDVLCETLGASPEDIRACIPTMSWRIDRETSPLDRASIVSMAINEWGLELDEEQQRDEFALNAPRPGSKPLKGKPDPNAQQAGDPNAQQAGDPEQTGATDDSTDGSEDGEDSEFSVSPFGGEPAEGSLDLDGEGSRDWLR